MSDDSVKVIGTGLVGWLQAFDVATHVQVGQGELDVAADLAGEVNVKSEPLEVDAQHLGKTSDTHLLHTVLEATQRWEKDMWREERRESERKGEGEERVSV